jgi:hypothetical protein
MAKPSDAPGFKQLLEYWNDILERDGFVDIEAVYYGNQILKRSGTIRRFERLDEITREAKFQFFQQVSSYVATTHFKSNLERQILEYYSQGYSQAAIKKMLAIQGHRCKVYYPIYRYLRLWGLK